MSLDTIGGFRRYRSSKIYMPLFVDHFTRYACILTAKCKNSEDYIKLIQPIAKENRIKKLLVDQFGAFKSRKFKRFVNKHNIELVFTAVDNPQSNGLNERLNQTLVNRKRCRINEEGFKEPW